MKSIQETPEGTSNASTAQQDQKSTGPFMVTLCELAAPMAIRPSESPHLKPFTFFVGRTPRPDGSEEFFLNMGYFPTLIDAQKWVQRVRGRYPNAMVAVAPPQPSAEGFVPVTGETLTDTGVMKKLETRAVEPLQVAVAEGSSAQIPLVRPDDTGVRRALKEAVTQGAPVSFAVQLESSAQPIDLSSVPAHALFKGRALYVTEIRREERSRYFLRLGFFNDPVSAKQFAFQVRSKFASSAVVPVTEQELQHAREPRFETVVTTNTVQAGAKPAPEADRKPKPPTRSKPGSRVARGTPRSGESLDETLEQLAERELLHDRDSVSESGVRHLKVEVLQERK